MKIGRNTNDNDSNDDNANNNKSISKYVYWVYVHGTAWKGISLSLSLCLQFGNRCLKIGRNLGNHFHVLFVLRYAALVYLFLLPFLFCIYILANHLSDSLFDNWPYCRAAAALAGEEPLIHICIYLYIYICIIYIYIY